MIASAILATGIFFVMGNMVNLATLRHDSDDVRKAAAIADSVVQSIQGTSWDDLNDRTKPAAYLAWARRVDPENNGIADDDEWLGDRDSAPAMVANGTTPESRRMLPQRVADDGTIQPLVSGLDGLRVYIEYYRAVTATDEEGARFAGPDGLPLLGGLVQGLIEFAPANPNGNRMLVRTSEDTNANTVLDIGSEDANSNGVLDPGEDFNFNGILDAATTEDLNGDGMISAIEPTRAQRLGGTGVVDQQSGVNRLPIYTTQTGVHELMLPADQSITSQAEVRLGANDPVAVRIVVTWIDSMRALPQDTTSALDREARMPRRFYEAFTLRRR
jgi:hypothetical protein